jgi:hypothetical protein
MIQLLLIPAITLVACQSKQSSQIGVDQAQLASALTKERVRFSKVRVTCSVVAEGEARTLDPLLIRRGRSSSTSLTSEEIYPRHFDFPEIGPVKVGDSFPITPANPTQFDAGQFGWALELAAGVRGGFIMLSGTLTDR